MGIAIGESKRKKVGLALGSGAARGLAHIGVLEILDREGIPIDMIAGTSIGALIGALYTQRKDVSRIKNLAMDLSSKRLAFLLDPALSRTGLIRGRKIEGTVRSTIGDIEFGDLRMPFACVATDIGSGEEVIIKRGLVWEGIRASGSLPVLFTVAKWEGRYLVDGTLVTPVPVRVLKEMGADFIISVNVLHHPGEKTPLHPEDVKEIKEPNIFDIMIQTVNILASHLVESSLSGADIVIEPNMADIGLADFHKAEECIQRGELAAQDSIPEIKRQLLL